MDVESADRLQRIVEQQQSLTTPHERDVQRRVAEWAAMRENDVPTLKSLNGWPADRVYVVDPLPGKISEAFGDLLFGEDPTFTAATAVEAKQGKLVARQAKVAAEAPESSNIGPDEDAPPDIDDRGEPDAGDQERLDAIIEANDLPSELRHAVEVSSSEGEVWWRVFVDPAQSTYPIIEWHSRSHVRPLFRGRKLVAAAFVSEIFREQIEDLWVLYRYIEIHSDGYVRNVLYRGTTTQLGMAIALSERPETEQLPEEWTHGLGMLAGRIPNKLGRDRRVGISDYHGVHQLLLSLNEATTIGQENARIAAKKRAVVPASAIQDDGRFDASEDVLIQREPKDTELGKPVSETFAILEYSFDAQALIAYKTDLAGVILTRVGIAQQFLNVTSRSSEGMAQSGTALRLRLIPTTLAANGKARYWDDALPKILMLAQLVDSMPEAQGGFGRNWQMPGEPPSVERAEPLPQDETEQIMQHASAVAAEIESRRTAIAALHPDWPDEQVEAELGQIDKELAEFGTVKASGPGAAQMPKGPPPGAQTLPAGPARDTTGGGA